MAREEISVNLEKLTEICGLVLNAVRERRGIFSEGFTRFLPQYSIPPELDPGYPNPESIIPEANRLQAAQYLWTLAIFERKTQSRQIIKGGIRAFADESTRGIFNPEIVSQMSSTEVTKVFRYKFQDGSKTRPQHYQMNSRKLLERYSGDPRKLVDGLTVEQARKNLMEFKGIGTGISNLYIIYLLDRGLASPSDPEKMLLKIDVHKSRVPLQLGAINYPPEATRIRRDLLVPLLEKAYREVCDKNNWSVCELDRALWVLGSESCAKISYPVCAKNCPLIDKCKKYIPENQETSVFTLDGEDLRRRKSQGLLDFMFTGIPIKQ